MIELARPEWLLALIPILALWLWLTRTPVGRSAAAQVSAERRRLSSALRLITLVVLILALAGLRQRLPSNRLTVTFLLDQSLSTRRQQVFMEDYLRQALNTRPKNARVAVVHFAGDAALELPASSTPYVPRSTQKLARDHTDLAAAIQFAAASQPGGESGRLVLISDGRETRGSLLTAAQALLANGIELDTVAVPQNTAPEFLVEELRTPPSIKVRTPYELVATIYASHPAPAELLLQRQGKLAGRFAVDLKPGRNVFLLPQRVESVGTWRYQLQLSVKDDGERSNNSAAGMTLAEGPFRVAVVHGANSPDRISPLLQAQGVLVDSLTPGQLPTEVGEWLNYQGVVLDDVAATDLGTDILEAMTAMVRDAGMGLVMVGGPDSYAAGGYNQTPLAEALPVDLRVSRQRVTPPTAQVHVIDKSGSMGELTRGVEHIAMAREASIAALELLAGQDEFGVVGFDDAAKWVVNLAPVGDRRKALGRIATLRAGGGTDMFPALSQAVQALSGSKLSSRHILVLSDGATAPADFDKLSAEARQKRIYISTIAVGDGADILFLEKLAKDGKGRSYKADSAHALPRIFARETMLASRSAYDERPATVALLGSHPVLQGVDAAIPKLLGHNLVTPRGAPHRVLMQTTGKDPVLAIGRYGLGKTVAFTGDSGRRWSQQWSNQDQFARLMVQMVRWSLPANSRGDLDLRTQVDGLGRLQVEAQVSPDQAPQGLIGTLVAPDGRSQTLELLQVSPDRFQVNTDFSGSGTFLLNIASPDGSLRTSYPISLRQSAELSGVEVQTRLLEQAAQAGRGRFKPTPEQLFRPAAQPRAYYQDLQERLFALALLLLLADVVVRRLPLPGKFRSSAPSVPVETESPAPAVQQLKASLKRPDKPRMKLSLDSQDSPSVPPPPTNPGGGSALEGLRKVRERKQKP